MAITQYYLANNAYVYPSSNANDGGEDNSELNLKTITKKLISQSFVVYDQDNPTASNLQFSFSRSTSPVGVVVAPGKCCINGYYFELAGITINTTDSSGTTLLSPSTLYNLVITLYYDGVGNIRSDGMAITTPNAGQLEFRGITIGLYTEEELSSILPSNRLVIGTLTTDPDGNLPATSGSYILNPQRFMFISNTSIIPPSGSSLVDWILTNINQGLSTLNKLQYWNEEGTEVVSSVVLSNNDVTITLEGLDSPISILDIQNRTQVAPSGETTLPPLTTPTYMSYSTYNGTSNLLARADHQHDERYLMHQIENPTSQPYQRIGNSGLYINGNLVLDSEGTINEDSSAIYMDSTTGSVQFAKNAFSVTDSGSIVTTGTITSGAISSSGDVTANRVYNAVWNDYADALPKQKDSCITPGDIISKCKNSNHYCLATKENQRLVVGVCSDTYGHLLGGDPEKSPEENLIDYIPVAVAGNVRVKVTGRVRIGDFIVPSKLPGIGKGVRRAKRGTVVGKALESKDTDTIGRILIQVMLS